MSPDQNSREQEPRTQKTQTPKRRNYPTRPGNRAQQKSKTKTPTHRTIALTFLFLGATTERRGNFLLVARFRSAGLGGGGPQKHTGFKVGRTGKGSFINEAQYVITDPAICMAARDIRP